jgi:hypothetical protein
VTATGSSQTIALFKKHLLPHSITVDIICTSVSVIDLKVYGSIDGSVFFLLAESTNASGEPVFISNREIKFLRLDLASLTGTSVTAKVTAV